MSPPPFRADHVGSLLRPQKLKDAARDFHAGRLDEIRFKHIQDECIVEAVAMQKDVGLRSITDGEFRRGSWFLGFVDAVEGLTTKDALFDFHDAEGGVAKFQTAYVDGKLKRTRGITTDEFSFIKTLECRHTESDDADAEPRALFSGGRDGQPLGLSGHRRFLERPDRHLSG